jgi:hypothetical protein
VAGDSPGFLEDNAISFQIPLASAPSFNFIATGGASTAQCPGSYAAPAAAAGQLCFYASVLSGATGMSTTSSTKFGVAYFATGATLNGNYEVDGDWAVTAP